MSSVSVNHPYGVVQLGGYIYIASQQDNYIYRTNLDLTNKFPFYSITTPIGLTTDGTYLYVSRGGSNSIYQINPATGLPTPSGAPWASPGAVYYLAADIINGFIYVSTGSTTITRIANNSGTVGTISTNWSTGYVSSAQMYVDNTTGKLLISDDNGVNSISLSSGGTLTRVIDLTSSGGASGNQSVHVFGNYLYVGTNNAQNISVYNYPSFTLVSNNWKTAQGNVTNIISYNNPSTYNRLYVSNYNGAVNLYEPFGICFLKGTKILCENGYRVIEDLKQGDLVKTIDNGFLPIEYIKHDTISNPDNNERTVDRLYTLSKSFYPELFENLVITGGHSILVDHLTDEQREQTQKQLGEIFITGNKYRLLASIDERTQVYPNQGVFDIYHICLVNHNDQHNYGIYANGLLVESCCKRHIVQ